MACDVFSAFALATENLDQEVYRNASYRSVWLNFTPRGTFETGKGTSKTTFTIENSEPDTDVESWKQITTDNSGILNLGGAAEGTLNNGLCNSDFADVQVGYSTKTYNVESFSLQGPVICKEDLLWDHNVDVFLRAYIEEMSKRAQRTWEKRYEALYMKLASKVAVGHGNNILDDDIAIEDHSTASGNSLQSADSVLTQEFLDQIAVEMIDRGATNPDSNGYITYGEDGPVFPLLIGLQASQQIALNNAELRQDFRDADNGAGSAAELMSRIGATRVIKNFRHVPSLRPPRYTYDAGTGQYTRVQTYEYVNTNGRGVKSRLTAAYQSAPYEAAILLNPAVYTSEVVAPINAAGGVNWNPSNYMGEWQWVTGGSKIRPSGDCQYDPLSKLGRHYAEFKHAPRPEFPTYGITLIFKRQYLGGGTLQGTNTYQDFAA